jgi:AraC family transcriptional regulator of adaptative response / DNA-3-methyladenine glycosylase II
MLEYLRKRAIPGVESVEMGVYRRSILLNGHQGYFEVSLLEGTNTLAARIHFGDPCSLFFITERIRAMFDLNADWSAIARALRTDPVLAKRVNAAPGLRVPGCWNGFELATVAILEQQTQTGANATAGRVARLFGQPIAGAGNLSHVFPLAQALAQADLARAGVSKASAERIRIVAREVCAGRLSFEGVVESSAFISRLREIPGIGDWTAEYIAMRAFGEPDAFPAKDAVLLRALGLKNSAELERRSEAWRPWRSYATFYLWNDARESRCVHMIKAAVSADGENS